MAFETPILDFTLVAAADLSALQFRAIKVDSNGKAAQNVSSAGAVVGVLQNKPTSGQAAQVRMEGITKFEAGAAVAAGDVVMSDTVGRCITAVTAANERIGIALQAAGAAGDYIAVKLASLGKV